MSVNSSAAAQHPAQTPEFPRHVVTAVLVAHDGARWLPNALSGLLSQDRPVQDVIAADTGSADDSARLLAESLGDQRVLHLARRSGFGAAVDEAVRAAGPVPIEQLPYLVRQSGWDPVSRTWNDDAYDQPEHPHGEPVHWLWLLHDDCEPAPDALAALLRVADAETAASRSAAVIGPKLRSWYDRRQLLEVGVSIARSGRRWTGLERREQDQGQHDQVRQVLSVSSAGMLVRRDVWEELGGFDRRLPLMRDDVDFCWRAQAAGHTVLIAPDAVLRHAEAASRERRPVDCVGRSAVNPHRVDKAGAAYTLLANTRGPILPYVMLRLLIGTVLRTLAYLVGKAPGQAVDEITGLLSVLLRPGRLLGARRQRGKGTVEPSELRPLFPPAGATVRATVEQVVSNLSGRSEEAASSVGRHGGAIESGPGGDEDGDYLEVEQFALLKRIARKPAPMLFAVLLLVSLIACRALLGSGALSGGALLPAPSSAGDLWASFGGQWHALGTGSTTAAPPYLAIVAAFAGILFGSTGLALTVLLVASVPLAGLTAYFASRPLVESRLLRAWAAVAYAFLPAATGALAGGRLGTAVLAILLPLMARAAVSAAGLELGADAISRGVRPGWRATWTFTLLLAITTAFTPITWLIALVLAVAVVVLRLVRGQGQLFVPQVLRSLAVLGTPIVVLAPWSLGLLAHPSRFLAEAGLPFGARAASASGLVLLSPGGPRAAGGVLFAGLVLAALAALLRAERRLAILTAWAGALIGLIFAVVENGSAWAGPATLLYGLALLAAATIGAEGAKERIAASGFGWRQPVAALIVFAAAAAPLIAAFGWMAGGADGPVERRDPTQVPAFVAEESSTADQARTLVLGGTASHVSYTLVRGAGVQLGDAELAAAAGDDTRLGGIVANLVAGSGADQAGQLGGYAVRYVLVQKGSPREMSRVLDSTPGLSQLSQADGSALWQVDNSVSRITITSKSGQPVAVAAGKVDAHTTIPAGSAGRVLRLADTAAAGWTATLDGVALPRTTVDGWAQGFELPAGGGHLDVTYQDPFTHTLWLWIQGFLALVLVVMALPGRRREVDDDLPEVLEAAAAQATAADIPAQATGDGRRARRLRAAAEAEAEGDGEAAAAAAEPVPVPDTPELDQEADPYAAVPQHQADPYAQQQWGEYQDGYQYAPQYPQQDYADPYSYGQQGQQQGQPQTYDPYTGQPHPAQPYEAPYYPTYDPDAPDGYPGDGSEQR
ncbi:glycosyltransferase family 2 protein [Actinacidiphila oryziradicis]|uniref:Glycosyltransferase n=1 Tax=Actinacidiphila oryziradicis TaxID=2571141 RepID=A0A4U0SM09_9ACTN|nr:glycosyltransferase family 2 protein [Actinacidiphila oryziradicis]TKA10098.1 glycosyltransferase [Actinacidiphila oryziradicis]